MSKTLKKLLNMSSFSCLSQQTECLEDNGELIPYYPSREVKIMATKADLEVTKAVRHMQKYSMSKPTVLWILLVSRYSI